MRILGSIRERQVAPGPEEIWARYGSAVVTSVVPVVDSNADADRPEHATLSGYLSRIDGDGKLK